MAGSARSPPGRRGGAPMPSGPRRPQFSMGQALMFAPSAASLAVIDLPALVLRGGASHPAVQRANELVSALLPRAELARSEAPRFHDGKRSFQSTRRPECCVLTCVTL